MYATLAPNYCNIRYLLKANALAIQLASRNVTEGTTNRDYLNNCYLPLFGIATYPLFDLESLAEKMFLQLESVFPNRADFFSKSKNPLDQDSVVRCNNRRFLFIQHNSEEDGISF